MRHGVRRRAERQHHRAPENAERREHQQRERAAHPQHAVVAQQRAHRRQQRRIADARARRTRIGQQPQQHDQHRDRERPRHEIHRAPAGEIGHEPRQRARGQQADHDAALRGAHHAAALARARERRRARDQALGHRSAEQPDAGHRGQQFEPRRRCGHAGARGRQQHQLHGDQPFAVQQVAERHDEQQRERTAELCRGDHAAHLGVRDAEVACDRIEQRLRVIDVRDARRAAHGQQRNAGGRQPAACIGRVRRMGRVRRIPG
ncbi:hypothetical protein BST28156_06943 [Burkholderia stagnalis]|nr:hypothetical protein BST28156_06943 [Burkholderia stagnalis]